jgi:hypothetical protein
MFEHDNEVLTDITAIYLGLGKLMLNGCECQRQWRQRTSQGTETTTTTLRSGYLTLDQFAFVYRLVCGMRRIPENTYLGGLSSGAVSAVKRSVSRYKYFFKTDFHGAEELDQIKQSLEKDIAPIRAQLNDLEAYLGHTKDLFDNYMTAYLQRSRKRIEEMSSEPFKQVNGDIYNPSLKFLLAVKCDCDVNSLEPEVEEIQRSLDMYIDCVSRMAKVFRRYDSKLFKSSSIFDLPNLRKSDRSKYFIKRSRTALAKLFRVQE